MPQKMGRWAWVACMYRTKEDMKAEGSPDVDGIDDHPQVEDTDRETDQGEDQRCDGETTSWAVHRLTEVSAYRQLSTLGAELHVGEAGAVVAASTDLLHVLNSGWRRRFIYRHEAPL